MKIGFLFLILVLAACRGKETRQQSNAASRHDSLGPANVVRSTQDSTAKAYALWARKDSIFYAKVLQEALSYADQHKDHPFQHRFFCNIIGADTGENVTVNMHFGHLFNKDCDHLIISREFYYGKVDVYLLKQGHFESQVSIDNGMLYLDNACRDINGDGYKDFVSHWYPSSGCCRANVFQVFLYQPASQSFTSMYEFLNPTFYPTDRLIRGVDYGHPGEVGLYKYKWNGLHVDTIEYIYPLRGKNGLYLRTAKEGYNPDSPEAVILHSIPSEYRKINDMDWFVMTE